MQWRCAAARCGGLGLCDLFRGRRPADYLARSAELVRCSAGPLSCTSRLRVDIQGATHGVRSEVRVQRHRLRCRGCPVGNVFYDRGFADVFLRHLKQTEGRMHMTMNLCSATSNCKVGSKVTCSPPKDDVARGGGHRPQSRRLGVEVRDALGPWRLTAGPDHNTSVLTTRTLQGLGPCRGPQRQQTPCSRVLPGKRRAPRRSGGCVVVDNASLALHAALSWSSPSLRSVALDTCHLPKKYDTVARIAVQRAPGCSVGLSASSTCPSLRRSALAWTCL